MTKLLQVNFILPGYTTVPIGGYRVIFEYADFLASRGHSTRVVFPMHVNTSALSASPLHRLRRSIWRVRTRIKNRPLIPWHQFHPNVRLSLVPDARDRSIPDADITFATAWTTAGPVAELAGSKGEKFYLIQHHEIMHGPTQEVNATWLLPLRKVVISRWLQDIGHKLGAKDLRHIANGINFNLFRILESPNKRPMHVVSLFHDEAYKGISDALAVFGIYHSLFPEVPVTMFGVPDRGQDIPDWINYKQNPSQSELVRTIYNRATIYLGASLAEGWALPPAEAMACGCAFVGTDSGGVRDYAINGETALLSPPGDKEQLLQNLVTLTTDTARRQRIQENGTKYISQFTWEKAGIALESYLLEAIGLKSTS